MLVVNEVCSNVREAPVRRRLWRPDDRGTSIGTWQFACPFDFSPSVFSNGHIKSKVPKRWNPRCPFQQQRKRQHAMLDRTPRPMIDSPWRGVEPSLSNEYASSWQRIHRQTALVSPLNPTYMPQGILNAGTGNNSNGQFTPLEEQPATAYIRPARLLPTPSNDCSMKFLGFFLPNETFVVCLEPTTDGE